MKKLLLSLLLFPVLSSAQINLPPITPYAVCEMDSDGYAVFILNTHISDILGGLSQNAYEVDFFETLSDAEAEINHLPNVYTNTVAFQQTIYVRVTESADSSNFTIEPFDLVVASSPNFTLTGNAICTDFITSQSEPAILDTGLSTDDYNFFWTYNGMPIANNQSSFSATMFGTYEVTVTSLNIAGCSNTQAASVIQSGPASPIGIGYTVSGQDITVTIQGYGNYRFQLDNGTLQQSNVFTNVSLGVHTIYVHDLNGCGVLEINVSLPVAPTGSGDQTFTPGETLADLEVEGENIQWYSGISPDSTNETQETPLPLSTLLVDGTTYYASQTINGIESEQRLGVTVHSALGIGQNNFTDFNFYPNPVINKLNITNTNNITHIAVYTTTGQLILEKEINSKNAELDFSHLQSGIYLAKITSEDQQKTIRIQKQ